MFGIKTPAFDHNECSVEQRQIISNLQRSRLVSTWFYLLNDKFAPEVKDMILNRLYIMAMENVAPMGVDNREWWSTHTHHAYNLLTSDIVSEQDKTIINKVANLCGQSIEGYKFLYSCILLAFRNELTEEQKFTVILYFSVLEKGRAKHARPISVEVFNKGVALIGRLIAEVPATTTHLRLILPMSIDNVLSFSRHIDKSNRKLDGMLADNVDERIIVKIVTKREFDHTPGLIWTPDDVTEIGSLSESVHWYKSSWSGKAAAIWKASGATVDEADGAYDKFGITNPQDYAIAKSTVPSWANAWSA